MKKAVIYARFSSDMQREESIDAQVRAITEYAKNKNINIIKIYADEAKSATTDDRPQFLQMIEDSKNCLFDIIIVHKLDRFSRNRYDSAIYKRKLQLNGIRLISVLENLDDSPESIILESVLEGMNEYYSANLAREVMKGQKENAYNCKHNGGMPPLGYKVNDDLTYSIDEKTAPAVHIIYQMYIDGYGYTKIAERLNNEGYRTQTGRKFSRHSMYGILRNEKYTGTYVFNRTVKQIPGAKRVHRKSKDEDDIIKIKDGMPRIIEDKIWMEVQNKLDNNLKGSNSAKEIYLLTGLIKCGKCNGAMIGNRRKAGRNKDLYVTYECNTRKRTKECDMKAINRDYVEELVISELEKNVFSDKAIQKITEHISSYCKTEHKTINADINKYTHELTGVQTQINNIVNAITNGMFHDSMKSQLDNLEDKKSKLTLRIQEANLQLNKHAPSDEMIKEYLSYGKKIRHMDKNEQKKLINTYVSSILVHEDNIQIITIVDFAGGDGAYITKSTINIVDYRLNKIKKVSY